MVEIGEKYIRKCRTCGLQGTIDDLTAFAYGKAHKYERMNWCKDCKNKFQRENNAINLAKGKYQFAKRYGITSDEYGKCMATSTICEICGIPKELCYDHDHLTMLFRGVLCRSCNKAIGALGDTSALVYKAYLYLKESENKSGK